jgi:hypothetical protein
MLSPLLNDAHKQLETVKSLLILNEDIRKLSSQNLSNIPEGPFQDFFKDLKSQSHDSTSWRVYDHCSAVTRIYATYEKFIEDLLSSWLGFIPLLIPIYQDLDEKVKNQHLNGVGAVISKLNKRRFRNLKPEGVMKGLYDGLTGSSSYELLPEAFFNTDRNYHNDILSQVFGGVGIENILEWLRNHREIKRYIHNTGESSSFDAELKNFIEYRNDAAHSLPDDILSLSGLIRLTDFFKAFFIALQESILNEIITYNLKLGKAMICGSITEVFRKVNACVAIIESSKLKIGEKIYLVGNNFCKSSTINSIKFSDLNFYSIKVDSKHEVGFKFDHNEIKENLKIVKLY